MASKRFKKIFLIRFFAYLSIMVGILALSFEFGPLVSAEAGFRKDQLFGIKYSVSPKIVNSLNTSQASSSASSGGSDFGSISSEGDQIVPVSTDFGIVIEKINANAKVIPNIDPNNEPQYVAALAQGVAEAKGSTDPGKPGNLYLFSHSTDAPWNVIRYNAIFYLLRELNPGDSVDIFYKGRRYNYIIYDKHTVDPSDVSYINNRYDAPVLTLQTCDPPGTLLHRLIIRAKLAGT